MRKLFLLSFGIVALTVMVFSMPVNALAQQAGNDDIVGQRLDDPPGDDNGGRGADDPPGDDNGGRGADDPPGDDNGGRGADDPPGDDNGGRGTDDPPGDDNGGRGADDPPGDDNGGRGADDPPGDDSNKKGKKPKVKSGKLNRRGVRCIRENSFRTDDDVYVKKAKRLPALTFVNIYVVQNKTWSDGDLIGIDVSPDGAEPVATNSNGKISCVKIWGSPEIGKYDIIVDANQNGIFDLGVDAVDGRGAKPGFRVR
ncbi:MAG: hypothetical protein ACUZ77_09615 [Candidatus Brocadiales bacterium]